MKTSLRTTAIAAQCLALIACGGGNGSSSATSATTQVRLANATGSSSLVMNAVGATDTTVTFTTTPVAVGSASGYLAEKAQTYTINVSSTDSALTGSTKAISLSSGTDYTLVAYARAGAIDTYTLVDQFPTPSAGFATLVIANAGSDAGTLDVYLVAPGGSLTGLAPTFATVTGGTTSGGKSLGTGTFDVVVTASGRPADVRLVVPSLTLASTEIVTVVLTSTQGGGLVDGAVVHQGGDIALHPSTKARVRLVGAFPAGASSNSIVSATIGSTDLPHLTAPSVGVYSLVPGNTSSYLISVDDVPVANLPAATFANGGDYTILAYGDPANPSVSVLTDYNLPLSNGSANIRTINAAVSGGGITLTDDYVPINVDVQYGESSGYSPATASSGSLIVINSPVAAFPTYTASDFSIASGGVYTVFVLGATSAPIVSFARDR